jgi:peptide/nickel transport system substrate-binding protein/oligopeptide transport system substrate-binding protein
MIEGEKIKKLRDGLEKIENSLKTIWGGISRAEASVEWFKGWMDRVKGFVSKVHTDFEIIKEKIGSVRKELAEARTTLRKFLPVYEDIEKEEEIVLKIPLGSDPVTLNPYLSTDAVSNIVIDSIHRSLFMVSPKSSKVLPFIVYRFEISDDGKRYIFELRRNVKFHDGTVVTASDVKKSLLRTLKGNLKHYFNMIKGADDYIKGFETDVEGIKVINDFKLEIELEYPFSPFIKNLALNAASITREKNNILIGCGPFKLVKWKKGEYIELECFEDYIAGRACVDRIIFQIKLKNELEDFINRNFDLIEPSKTHIEILKEKAPEYIDRLQMVPQFSVQRFDFNVKKEPLTDIHIRKAIAHAVDVDRFVKEITGQAGIRAKGVLPPSSEFYDETLEPLEYNLEKAKEELKKSEFKPPYKLIVIVRPAEAYKRNARFVLECIKDLGFEFEFVERDWAGLLEDIKKGKAHCHFIGWLADTGDPDSIFYPVFYSSSIGKGGNEMHFSDPEIDALIEEARRKRLPEERKKIYNIIERKIIEKCPCIFLYHPYQMLILNKGVYGIWPHPLGHFRLELALKLSSKWIR